MTTSELKKEIQRILLSMEDQMDWTEEGVEDKASSILSLFTSQQEEMRRKIESLKKDEISAAQGNFSQEDYTDHGYNQALEDLLKDMEKK